MLFVYLKNKTIVDYILKCSALRLHLELNSDCIFILNIAAVLSTFATHEQMVLIKL